MKTLDISSTDDNGYVATQIAAMNPVAVSADAVPAAAIERERAIVTEQIKTILRWLASPMR